MERPLRTSHLSPHKNGTPQTLQEHINPSLRSVVLTSHHFLSLLLAHMSDIPHLVLNAPLLKTNCTLGEGEFLSPAHPFMTRFSTDATFLTRRVLRFDTLLAQVPCTIPRPVFSISWTSTNARSTIMTRRPPNSRSSFSTSRSRHSLYEPMAKGYVVSLGYEIMICFIYPIGEISASTLPDLAPCLANLGGRQALVTYEPRCAISVRTVHS